MKSEDEEIPKNHMKSILNHMKSIYFTDFQLQKTTALHQAAPASRRPRTHGQARRLHAAEGQWWVAAHEVVHEAHSGLEKERQPWG